MEEPRAPSSSAEPPAEALDFALRRLSRRAHSRGELTAKMARAGYDEDAIRATLGYLDARGYLDDALFAREVARASAARKNWGPARIERRLRDLKLSAPDIEEAIGETFPDGEELSAARAFDRFLRVSRRKRGSLDDERERARAFRHLVGRGFSPSIVRRLVSTWKFEDTCLSDDDL